VSAFEQLNTATISSVTTAPRSFIEYDEIVVTAVPVLGAGETITVQIVGSAGLMNFLDPTTGLVYTVTSANQAVRVPGGYSMSFTKSATAAPTAIEVHTKPRAAVS